MGSHYERIQAAITKSEEEHNNTLDALIERRAGEKLLETVTQVVVAKGLTDTVSGQSLWGGYSGHLGS